MDNINKAKDKPRAGWTLAWELGFRAPVEVPLPVLAAGNAQVYSMEYSGDPKVSPSRH
jgi:hypothetical protein